MATVFTPQICPESRATLRPIRPGNMASCSACGQAVKFNSRERRYQVIANVYVHGCWDRVEHFHPDCYASADRPHGDTES